MVLTISIIITKQPNHSCGRFVNRWSKSTTSRVEEPTACGLLNMRGFSLENSSLGGASVRVMNIERRFKARYPLELNVRYQSFGKSGVISGEGRTVNLSSSGVLVASSDKMSDGMRLKLTIEWPSLLNGTTPLQLVTFGRVVRCDNSSFAVALEHYQFRTMKRKTDLTIVAATSGLTMPVNSPRAPAAIGDQLLHAVTLVAKSSS